MPAVVLIRDDLAIGVGGGANLADVRGAVIVPAVLVPAHELQPDGFAGQLRQNRGCLRYVVIATVAIRARSFVILHANFWRGNSEHAGESVARGVHILRGANNQRGIGFHVRERAIGPETRVRLIRSVIIPGDNVRGLAERAGHVTSFEHNSVRGFFGAHRVV